MNNPEPESIYNNIKNLKKYKLLDMKSCDKEFINSKKIEKKYNEKDIINEIKNLNNEKEKIEKEIKKLNNKKNKIENEIEHKKTVLKENSIFNQIEIKKTKKSKENDDDINKKEIKKN
jgi:hypothetical protein